MLILRVYASSQRTARTPVFSGGSSPQGETRPLEHLVGRHGASKNSLKIVQALAFKPSANAARTTPPAVIQSETGT